MSIPREVMLETHNGRIKLVQKPVAELTILRKDTMSYKNTNLSVIHSAITELKFKQFELKARISTANKSGFSLKFKKNGTQYSEFIFDFINQEIIFNRSKSGGFYDQYFAQLQVAPLIIENGFTDLHLFVDNSSAELFSAGGQVVMSNQIFPDSTSNRIELTPLDQDLLVDEFDIWNFEKGRVPLPDTIPPPSLPLPQKLFEVFPNPIAGAQDLTVRINNAAGDVKFELFNPAGMLIDVFHSSESFMVIPSTRFSYSKGLYILKGTNGKGGVLTRKILVF